ncbi:MAG: transporter [bacterium]|nr:transporter [bacterium]
MPTWVIFSIVIIVSVVTVIGDYFIKLSGGKADKVIDFKTFGLGLFFYILTAFGWFVVMKYFKLSTIGIVYGITTAILLVAVGVFYFKESLSFYEMVGIGLGILALILLGRFTT